MTTLAEVHATTTPGHRAQAAGRLIDQHQRDIEAARLIQRQAVEELLLHGATTKESARLCGVPVWLVEQVRNGFCCGHEHSGPELGGICIGCACEVTA